MTDNVQSAPRIWAVVPAAGASQRMGAGVPKQYLPLAGRTVIEWSLAPFLGRDDCDGVVVIIGRDDRRWSGLAVAGHPKITTAIGGAERADSVRAGLAALERRAAERDWVLVHDAARPCLAAGDLGRLLRELDNDEVGGLLAVPLVDTLKRCDGADRVVETISRKALWRALTPQMFRYGVLRRALALAGEKGVAVTDEAQAVEALDMRPRLIAGDACNIKITVGGDLLRAEQILRSRGAM